MRNKIPILGLLDFDIKDLDNKTGLANILNLLGHYAHLNEEEKKYVLDYFDKAKVHLS